MKFVISTLALILLAGCSVETDKQPLSIPDMSNQSDEVKKLVTENWNNLLEQCPGLSRYQDDLKFSKITNYIDPIMGDESRVDITYIVTKDAQKIPNSYKAWGHHCHFGIKEDGNSLSISKSACISLCLDEVYLDDNANYTASF